jgi:hypothetical protein
MHIGNAITSILLADLFDKNNETGGHPPAEQAIRQLTVTKERSTRSNSFAEHPERW